MYHSWGNCDSVLWCAVPCYGPASQGIQLIFAEEIRHVEGEI